MKAKTAQDVPIHIIKDLYKWVSSVDHEYLRRLSTQGNLISIHIIGGGMQIRNFLRNYPNELDLNSHWLDNNWIEITERMLEMCPE